MFNKKIQLLMILWVFTTATQIILSKPELPKIHSMSSSYKFKRSTEQKFNLLNENKSTESYSKDVNQLIIKPNEEYEIDFQTNKCPPHLSIPYTNSSKGEANDFRPIFEKLIKGTLMEKKNYSDIIKENSGYKNVINKMNDELPQMYLQCLNLKFSQLEEDPMVWKKSSIDTQGIKGFTDSTVIALNKYPKCFDRSLQNVFQISMKDQKYIYGILNSYQVGIYMDNDHFNKKAADFVIGYQMGIVNQPKEDVMKLGFTVDLQGEEYGIKAKEDWSIAVIKFDQCRQIVQKEITNSENDIFIVEVHI